MEDKKDDRTIEEMFKVYTLEEIAELLNVTRRTMYNYIKSGRLKAVKIGSIWRVSEDNLKKFIDGE